MAGCLCLLLVAFATFQVLVSADGTVCGRVPHEALKLTGPRRWYYCKTSGSTNDGGCFIDVEPDGNGLLILSRTRYNNETQKLEVKTFNMTEAENEAPPEKDANGVEFAHTEDKNCMLRMRCGENSAPFILFACRDKSGCEDGIHDEFIEKKIGEVKNLEGMEEVGTKMQEYYNEKNCGE